MLERQDGPAGRWDSGAPGHGPTGARDDVLGARERDDQPTVALIDVPRWTEHLRSLPGWVEGDRASTLLLRQPPVRVLLSALRESATLGSDGAEETVLITALDGAASVEWGAEVARIRKGEIALVPPGGGWRCTSEAPETVLLSVFWGTPGEGEADATLAAQAAR